MYRQSKGFVVSMVLCRSNPYEKSVITARATAIKKKRFNAKEIVTVESHFSADQELVTYDILIHVLVNSRTFLQVNSCTFCS